MKNLFDLSGRVALITGAGRGIGRETARVLAGAGANIVVADILEKNAEEAAQEMTSMGCESIAFQLDVRDSAAVERVTEQTVDKFGRIDILVNNAGIARQTPSIEISDQEWLDVIDINLNGLFWCCRSVGRRMIGQRSGAIVNIASMSGTISNRPQNQAHYNPSKAAVIMLTKTLGAEWAEYNVRVNSVSPGYTASEMTKAALEKADNWRRVWVENTPMGRLGEPNEIAHAVWYLASDASSFCTGTDLIIDGGYTCW